MKEYNVRVRYVKEADFYVGLEAENDDEAIKNAADPYYNRGKTTTENLNLLRHPKS